MTESEHEAELAQDIWNRSFLYADQYMGIMKDVILDELDKETEADNHSQTRIAQTNGLLLLACFMNQEVLDDEILERAMAACRKAMKLFLANNNGQLNS
jgi:hypothetical protein